MGLQNNNQELGDCYDYTKFTLNNGQSNYNVKANQPYLFLNVKLATKIIIDSNQPLSIAFNRVTYQPIDFYAQDSPSEYVNKLRVFNLFISNASGQTATIRVWLFP
jgi:hypothetical protein